MNLSGIDEVKKKIANIRSQYNHELTKIKDSCRSGVSTDDVYEPNVWWFEALSFLKPYIKPRNGKNSYSQQSEPRNEDTIDVADNLSSSESSVIEVKEAKALPKAKKVKTLTSLQNEISNRNTDGRNEHFGKYVVSELNEIDDVELLMDCKNEINNNLSKYKKAYIRNVNNVMEFELQ
ncbi:hypothetical protein RI129_003043 [Pyrocoelia pectoralis]|uniref:MADF domain-containing protein n=1 Tax=Pyrocoelia pectoralis TaxID=417401 RepID=A0AAN7VNF7_9COLE